MVRLVSVVLLLSWSVPAAASQWVFAAALSGASEFPSVVSSGSGTAVITLDDVAHMLTVDVVFSGLTGPTTVTHIHCCVSLAASTPTAAVASQTPSFAGFPAGVTSGTYAHTFDTLDPSTYNPSFVTAHGGTPAGAESALVAGLGAVEAYLNIHTTMYPAGEIRGFLSEVPLFADGFQSGDTSEWDAAVP